MTSENRIDYNGVCVCVSDRTVDVIPSWPLCILVSAHKYPCLSLRNSCVGPLLFARTELPLKPQYPTLNAALDWTTSQPYGLHSPEYLPGVRVFERVELIPGQIS